MIFLDTNILLRHLLNDEPTQSPQATALLGKIENGDVEARIADTIIFETVFTLQRQYKIPKVQIRETLLPLLQLPGIKLAGKRRLLKVFNLYVEHNLPFADAYHTVMMKQLGINEIASFDEHFDHIPGIKRLSL